jgi:hypothetical protein
MQAALKSVAAAGLTEMIAAGNHGWFLDFELSANREGNSLLRLLREFQLILPIVTDVPFSVARAEKIKAAVKLANAADATVLGAILHVLDMLEITSPEVGRNKEYPALTEFRSENRIFGIVISENAIVFV